jgi:hypothetical protein
MDDYLVKERRFRMGLRKNIAAAQSGRRDVTDVLRTALWFADVRSRLSASTAYEVERILEPKAFGRNEDGDCFHRNKWTKYEVGRHTPSDLLVASVDARLPGTERMLNHVLWKALQTKQEIGGHANDWLRQLGPDIQKIVFQTHPYGSGNSYQRLNLSQVQLKMLERRAGVDALACLTILLRESYERGESSHTFDIGSSLYRVLLILCTAIPIGNFTFELFDVYSNRIFSLVRHKGLRFRFEDFDFVEAVSLLHVLLLTLEDNNQIGLRWDDSVRAMCKLLNGDYGFDIKFALDAPIGPDEALTTANAKDYREFKRLKRLRQWGQENIMSGGSERFPPGDLL